MAEPYMFIDGGCLTSAMAKLAKRYWNTEEFDLNFSAIRGGNAKAFYYDAVPTEKKPSETEEEFLQKVNQKLQFLNFVSKQDSFHVRTGDAKHRPRRGGLEQKKVDVQLAVDVMSYAHRGVYDKVTIVTSDLDFKPLIDAVVDMGFDVTLIYAQSETSEELITSADRATPIAINNFYNWFSGDFKSINRLPHFYFSMHEHYNVERAILHWDAPGYGRAFLLNELNEYQLYTQTAPNGQHTLRGNFSDLNIARLYAEDVFGLFIPELT